MQRRNFKMPSKNFQHTQVKGGPPPRGRKKEFNRGVKGLPAVRQSVKGQGGKSGPSPE